MKRWNGGSICKYPWRYRAESVVESSQPNFDVEMEFDNNDGEKVDIDNGDDMILMMVTLMKVRVKILLMI